MVQTFPMRSPQALDATLRAFTSLSRRDANAVHATVRAAARSHTVEEHDDYDGYLSLLITPASDRHPSFIVAGRTGAVEIAELWGDEMCSLGTFPSIGAAMIVLRPRLERTEPVAGTKQITDAAELLVERHGADANLQAALQADARPGQRPWPSILFALDELGKPQ